ncbi:hypothetical protein PGB90_005950 [Kerria lacca]
MINDDDLLSVCSENKTRTSKGSFRRRLKSLGSTADRSRNSFIDGTKTVSSRIVKKALRRRSSKDIISTQNEIKEDDNIPVCEIFESIKFDFPATQSCSSVTFEEEHLSDDENLPPPQFPPPPLPEHFFEELFSDQSSNSYSDSQYELLEKSKRNSSDDVDVPFYGQDNFDLNSETLSNSLGNESEIRSNFGDDFMDNFNSILSNFDMNPRSEVKDNIDSFFSSSETGSSNKSVEMHNYSHSYENWTLHATAENILSTTSLPSIVKSPSPTKSIIIQFDPLYDSVCAEEEDNNNDTLSDLFCKLDIQSMTRESCNETDDLSTVDVIDNEKLNELLKHKRNSIKSSSSVSGWSIKRAFKAVSDNTHWSRASFSSIKSVSTGPSLKTNDGVLNKPDICSTSNAMLHNGYMYRSPSVGEKSKDFIRFWCQLSEGKFYFSPDKDSTKEFIDLNTILSIHLIKDQKLNNEGEELYCFETTVSTKIQRYLFATLCSSERCVWMQKLFENLTLYFPPRLTADFIRAGWCFLKECINGTWNACWILLQKRTLIYTRGNELVEVDLRKARNVGLQETDDVSVSDKGGKQVIQLDTVSRYLYLIMGRPSETSEWQRVIKAAAMDNSRGLEDQQLTKDDIPVIVEKCINFVYAHGSMSEGIYRRSGSNSSITKLLSAFRQDSWSVQLSRQEYTEYDVASVLKRFFRDLPEPLFTVQLHKLFCNAPAIECSEEDKLSLYRNILEQLKPINYVTVRKLIGHLYAIHLQRQKNLMSVENLAAIWGPTLMHVENNDSSQWSIQECKALSELISLFPKLFLIDKKEMERENKIREVLEKHHNTYASIPQSFKPSGDLKVWIYLKSKENGENVNITIDPNKTCESVCRELASKMNVEPHLLCLHEVICNDSLTRPLHYKERVLDSVLRWGYWDEIDRKNNYLLLSTNNVIQEIFPLAKPPLTVCNDLMYADRKMKSFKSYFFEFSSGILSYYKDKKNPVKTREWNIDDIVWYMGYETKRNPRCRSKENPYFGYTIAGINKEEQMRWIAALLIGQYPDGDLLLPVSLLH